MNVLDRELAERLVAEHGTPLFLIDCFQLQQQVERLQGALPGVQLYYALKALAHPKIVRELDALGVGFDIASVGESNLLRDEHINPRRTIHTHPVKSDRDIRDALRFGCTTFVVDNPLELEKFKPYRDRVGLLIRIGFRNTSAVVDLARKFGCQPADVEPLLARAAELGILVKGFSFHVGSQCSGPQQHEYAIEQCAQLLRQLRFSHPQLSVLDIGGGFPVDYDTAVPEIDTFCAPIRAALQHLPEQTQVIAEPGRYLIAPAGYSISRVVGQAERGGVPWYYIDDGVYGCYSGQLFDHARYPLQVFAEGEKRPAVIAGPTCDSIDVVAEDIPVPPLAIGDLVIGSQMGAYTHASATQFNGIQPAKFVAINGRAETPTVAYIG